MAQPVWILLSNKIMHLKSRPSDQKPQRRLTPMDYLAIVGGLINLVVISLIIGYWFIHAGTSL